MQTLSLALFLQAISLAQQPSLPPPANPPIAADLVLTGGRVVSMDDFGSTAEAIAIQSGRILKLGTAKEIANLVTENTRVIQLEGRLAIPGFIEGHAHFFGVGDSAMQLDLRQATSWSQIVDQVAAAAKEMPKGALIRGRGWHQEKWTRVPQGGVEGLPHHKTLSQVSPDHPVVLTHASGHATFANAAAMELSGISAATDDPLGGEILRDESGKPIGAFREAASGLLGPAYMKARQPDPRRLARLAVGECLRRGVTSFQDLGGKFEELEVLRGMADQGSLDVRVWMALREPALELKEQLPKIKVKGYGDDHLTLGGIKRSIDGALGSHGAWLLEPYADLSTSAGLNTASIEDVIACAALALENGLQLCVHAIGDRANREVLNIYEATFSGKGDRKGLRWRIEHAQHLHPDDVARFAELGVIAAMQGIHCTSDAPWVYRRLGADRAASGAYLWRSLLDAGAVVTNGTDAPVENLNPILSFYASVTRKLPDGTEFFPEQKMTRMEALRSYTLSNAYAVFEEDLKGSLEPGKLADIVILSKDILTCPDEEILDAEVLTTIVGGEVLYQRK